MAAEYDPTAPYGWFGEDENQQPHHYPPIPSSHLSVDQYEHSLRTDVAACWYYARGGDARAGEVLATVHHQPNPFHQPPPLPAPALAPVAPAAPIAPVTATVHVDPALQNENQHGPQQQDQQHQQQQQRQPPPTFPGPAPDQTLYRYDRYVRCLHCNWFGDRVRKAQDHVVRNHQGVPAVAGQGYEDLGMIFPRYR